MAVMAPTMMANGGMDSTGCARRRQTVSHSSFIRFDPEGKGDARRRRRRRERRAEVVGRGRTMIVEE